MRTVPGITVAPLAVGTAVSPADPLDGPTHPQGAGVKVDIVPLQAERLALAQTQD
jgi:hypothetical protein